MLHKASGELLWIRQWIFGFHKRQRISWLAERLLASQELVNSFYIRLQGTEAAVECFLPLLHVREVPDSKLSVWRLVIFTNFSWLSSVPSDKLQSISVKYPFFNNLFNLSFTDHLTIRRYTTNAVETAPLNKSVMLRMKETASRYSGYLRMS
jgi:hypothetical protein